MHGVGRWWDKDVTNQAIEGPQKVPFSLDKLGGPLLSSGEFCHTKNAGGLFWVFFLTAWEKRLSGLFTESGLHCGSHFTHSTRSVGGSVMCEWRPTFENRHSTSSLGIIYSVLEVSVLRMVISV